MNFQPPSQPGWGNHIFSGKAYVKVSQPSEKACLSCKTGEKGFIRDISKGIQLAFPIAYL
jgi:hypothetical protein